MVITVGKKIVMNAMMKGELNKLIASGEVTNICGECGKRTNHNDIIGLRKRDNKLHVICNDHWDIVKENCTHLEDDNNVN